MPKNDAFNEGYDAYWDGVDATDNLYGKDEPKDTQD
jgi:hypothetical protein